jgi:hypothetical protein
MTSFLFIISFLLHIVSIVAIYALYKQLTLSNSSRDNSGDQGEIMELMETYLEEIKQENRNLQQQITNRTNVSSGIKPREKVNLDQVVKNPVKESEEDYQVPIQEDIVQDDLEVSLQSRILKLHREGKTIEEIARELNCGKTEVELILKFQEKNK